MSPMSEELKFCPQIFSSLGFISLYLPTNDPGLPDSPDRSDLAVGASGWGCIKCQSGVCHLDKDQSLTVDFRSFVCSSRCTAALVVLLSVF